jgi:aspartate-semialdehyde dehydrogenase
MEVVKGKIPVAILGATGMVGQKFIELLHGHPWFEIKAVAASERSQGKPYGAAVRWRMSTPLPEAISELTVLPCVPNLPVHIVFSGLDADVAGSIEEAFAKGGYQVISNARNHRMRSDVPLLIPEVNSDHLALIDQQPYGKGCIVTNPNCSSVGLSMALKPLVDRWGVSAVNVVTMQAISGAGYPGVASWDILDNVIPYIAGEEAKVESEPLKILGKYGDGAVIDHAMCISAHCNRVAVVDGHTAAVSVRLERKASAEDLIASWQEFSGEPQRLKLPSAPLQPIHYFADEFSPQPKLHRMAEHGMQVSIGRLRPCKLLDWKFVVLAHNTIRGAAGGALLNGELMISKRGTTI